MLEIRRYGVWQANYELKYKVTGKQANDPPSVSESTNILIQQWHGENQITKESISELISALDHFAQSTKRISVTLAALPAGNIRRTIVEWCRQNIDPNILVEFKFNSAICGGMVVRYGSHIYDWSFRRQILASIDKFPEALRSVR